MAEYNRRRNLRNSTKRIPVCFVLDNSGSMNNIYKELGNYTELNKPEFINDGETCREVSGGTTKLDLLVKGLANFRKAIDDDDYASGCCEDCIIEFDESSRIVQDFTLITYDRINSYKKDYATGSNTNLTPAIELALKTLDERKVYLDSNRISRNQPWLVIFSDGDFNDDISEVTEKLKELQYNDKLIVYVMALDKKEETLEKLKDLTINGTIDASDPTTISKFFVYLARSVSVQRRGLMKKEFNINSY